MTTSQNDWTRLKSTFEQDLKTTQRLYNRLQKEQKALETRNYDLFQQIVSEKQTLLAMLESQVLLRQQWLAKTGFDDETIALEAAKKQAADVAKVWCDLQEHWRRCQELNEINEQIASRTYTVVGKMLDTLRGQTSQQRLYTNKGFSQSTGTGHTISNA